MPGYFFFLTLWGDFGKSLIAIILISIVLNHCVDYSAHDGRFE